jgi:succinate dehydrogenase/fumarate reductase-like Fe-S protein
MTLDNLNLTISKADAQPRAVQGCKGRYSCGKVCPQAVPSSSTINRGEQMVIVQRKEVSVIIQQVQLIDRAV